LVAKVLGSAHNGAGKMATGPATRAVRINFLREKLDLTVFFMGETNVLYDQYTPIQGRAKPSRSMLASRNFRVPLPAVTTAGMEGKRREVLNLAALGGTLSAGKRGRSHANEA
jgi:hypothetical protein